MSTKAMLVVCSAMYFESQKHVENYNGWISMRASSSIVFLTSKLSDSKLRSIVGHAVVLVQSSVQAPGCVPTSSLLNVHFQTVAAVIGWIGVR